MNTCPVFLPTLRALLLAVIASLACTAAFALSPQEQANKDVVLAFYEAAINRKDAEAAVDGQGLGQVGGRRAARTEPAVGPGQEFVHQGGLMPGPQGTVFGGRPVQHG